MTKPKIFNLLLFLTLSLCHSTVFAQTERLDSVMINGHMRRFKMVLPTTLKADAPMVMVLHGYSSSYLKKRTYMDKAAEAHGFALCVPDGLKDPAGKRSWNVGYPKQEGWKMDDVHVPHGHVERRRDVLPVGLPQSDHLPGAGIDIGPHADVDVQGA